MDKKKIVGILLVAGIAYYFYSRSQSSSTSNVNYATDAELQRMIATANANGADTFQGTSFLTIKSKFGRASSSDIASLTYLFSIKESSWTSAMKATFNSIWSKY